MGAQMELHADDEKAQQQPVPRAASVYSSSSTDFDSESEVASTLHNLPVLTNTRSRLDRERSRLDREDAERRYNLERQEEPGSASSPKAKLVVRFSAEDVDNPNNWSFLKKSYILFTGMVLIFNSTISSSMPSNAMDWIAPAFGVTSDEQRVLPVTVFLIGYVVGPLVFSPLSEELGRKPILLATFSTFLLFTVACALATSWPMFLGFRLVCGIGASAPTTIVGGLYADVFGEPRPRGRAMSVLMAMTTYGPLLGPLVSGYVAPARGWRWCFWVALILAGITWCLLVMMPETFGPVILKKRAARLRKKTGMPYVSPIEVESKGFRHTAVITLTRPMRMLCFEAIVLFSSLYCCLLYTLLYFFMQAYPIIFTGVYGFGGKALGLSYLPIGVGASIACIVNFSYDFYLARAQRLRKPWAAREEFRRLPLACLGGPFLVIGLFWLAWTCRASIPWIVPVLAGLPVGFGYMITFIALVNYTTDAYDVFAASAMAASATSRSLVGALMQLAAAPMYGSLGPHWATSILGFVAAVMCVIPFVFIRYGDGMRRKSEFCQLLAREKAKEREEREKERGRMGSVDSGDTRVEQEEV